MEAAGMGRLEVVRLLLTHPGVDSFYSNKVLIEQYCFGKMY
jgi:hypothetical protein